MNNIISFNFRKMSDLSILFFIEKFKSAYAKFGSCWVATAEMIEDKNGIGFRYYSECAIESKAINFMKYDDIKEGDYYSILKSKKV